MRAGAVLRAVCTVPLVAVAVATTLPPTPVAGCLEPPLYLEAGEDGDMGLCALQRWTGRRPAKAKQKKKGAVQPAGSKGFTATADLVDSMNISPDDSADEFADGSWQGSVDDITGNVAGDVVVADESAEPQSTSTQPPESVQPQFVRLDMKWCPSSAIDHDSGKFTDLSSAQALCALSDGCTGVFKAFCDEEQSEAWLCRGDVHDTAEAENCFYAKLPQGGSTSTSIHVDFPVAASAGTAETLAAAGLAPAVSGTGTIAEDRFHSAPREAALTSSAGEPSIAVAAVTPGQGAVASDGETTPTGSVREAAAAADPLATAPLVVRTHSSAALGESAGAQTLSPSATVTLPGADVAVPSLEQSLAEGNLLSKNAAPMEEPSQMSVVDPEAWLPEKVAVISSHSASAEQAAIPVPVGQAAAASTSTATAAVATEEADRASAGEEASPVAASTQPPSVASDTVVNSGKVAESAGTSTVAPPSQQNPNLMPEVSDVHGTGVATGAFVPPKPMDNVETGSSSTIASATAVTSDNAVETPLEQLVVAPAGQPATKSPMGWSLDNDRASSSLEPVNADAEAAGTSGTSTSGTSTSFTRRTSAPPSSSDSKSTTLVPGFDMVDPLLDVQDTGINTPTSAPTVTFAAEEASSGPSVTVIAPSTTSQQMGSLDRDVAAPALLPSDAKAEAGGSSSTSPIITSAGSSSSTGSRSAEGGAQGKTTTPVPGPDLVNPLQDASNTGFKTLISSPTPSSETQEEASGPLAPVTSPSARMVGSLGDDLATYALQPSDVEGEAADTGSTTTSSTRNTGSTSRTSSRASGRRAADKAETPAPVVASGEGEVSSVSSGAPDAEGEAVGSVLTSIVSTSSSSRAATWGARGETTTLLPSYDGMAPQQDAQDSSFQPLTTAPSVASAKAEALSGSSAATLAPPTPSQQGTRTKTLKPASSAVTSSNGLVDSVEGSIASTEVTKAPAPRDPVLAPGSPHFSKLEDMWCRLDSRDPQHPEKFGDLASALHTCRASASCTGVFVTYCDEARHSFWLCGGPLVPSSVGNCVYQKDGPAAGSPLAAGRVPASSGKNRPVSPSGEGGSAAAAASTSVPPEVRGDRGQAGSSSPRGVEEDSSSASTLTHANEVRDSFSETPADVRSNVRGGVLKEPKTAKVLPIVNEVVVGSDPATNVPLHSLKLENTWCPTRDQSNLNRFRDLPTALDQCRASVSCTGVFVTYCDMALQSFWLCSGALVESSVGNCVYTPDSTGTSGEASGKALAAMAGSPSVGGAQVKTSAQEDANVPAVVVEAAPEIHFKLRSPAWCPEGAIDPAHPEAYTGLEEAKAVCAGSGSCTGVYDHLCDGVGEFWLCSGKYNGSPQGSCIYSKQ